MNKVTSASVRANNAAARAVRAARAGSGGSGRAGTSRAPAASSSTDIKGAVAGGIGTAAAGAGAGAGFWATARNVIAVGADTETAAAKLGITTGTATKDIQAGIAGITAEANRLGYSAQQATNTALIFAAAGLDVKQSLGVTIPTLKAARAGYVEIDDAARAVVATMTNLNIGVDKVPQALERISVAGKHGMVEVNNMAQSLPQVAASAQKLRRDWHQGHF